MIIPGFSKYDITEDGVITNITTGAVSKQYLDPPHYTYRYKKVRLVDDNNKIRVCSVLKLLALTYLPQPDYKAVVRVKDGDTLNTTIDNVYWLPYSEMLKIAWEDGKMHHRKPREGKCCTKESVELVYETLLQLSSPTPMSILSEMLQVPYSTVRYSVEALCRQGRAVKTGIGVVLK